MIADPRPLSTQTHDNTFRYTMYLYISWNFKKHKWDKSKNFTWINLSSNTIIVKDNSMKLIFLLFCDFQTFFRITFSFHLTLVFHCLAEFLLSNLKKLSWVKLPTLASLRWVVCLPRWVKYPPKVGCVEPCPVPPVSATLCNAKCNI